MNLRNTIFIYLMLIILMMVPATAQVSVPALHATIHQYMNQRNIPGMAMGFVTPNEEGLYTYGYADQAQTRRIGEKTIFELGEVSATFTTAMMIDMYFEDEINIYQPLQFFVPPYVEVPCFEQIVCRVERPGELRVPPNVEGVPLLGGVSCYAEVDTPVIPITFCRLATHHAGLPSYPEKLNKYHLSTQKNKARFFPEKTRTEDIYQIFMSQELMSRPGTQYHYSNLGTAILGHILAYQKQITYGQLLEKRISNPLGLLNTVVSLGEKESPLMATGYNLMGKAVVHRDWEGFAPAMGIKSTPEDMMIYLEANAGVLQAQPLVAAFDECHVPHGLIWDKHWKDLRTGYGWFVLPLNKGKTYRIWSEGSTTGFSSFIGIIPETQTGVFLMSNSPRNLRKLGFDLMELVEQTAQTDRIEWREAQLDH